LSIERSEVLVRRLLWFSYLKEVEKSPSNNKVNTKAYPLSNLA